MNDFTTTTATTETVNSTGRNIAIGATIASVVALLGIGTAIVLGGGNTNVAPVPASAAVEAPVTTDAPADPTAAPVVTPVVTLSADTVIPAATPTPIAQPAVPAAPAADPAPKNDGPCPTYRSTNHLPLQLCDKGAWVSDVQHLLTPFADVAVDGYFGPQTDEAVKFMQGQWGFAQNGIVTQELIDVISKIDPSCNADGSMCEPYDHAEADEHIGEGPHGTLGYNPDDFHGEEFEGEGPHGDHLGYSQDDYCIDLLFDANHAPGQVTVDPVEVANCEAWLAI